VVEADDAVEDDVTVEDDPPLDGVVAAAVEPLLADVGVEPFEPPQAASKVATIDPPMPRTALSRSNPRRVSRSAKMFRFSVLDFVEPLDGASIGSLTDLPLNSSPTSTRRLLQIDQRRSELLR